MIGGISKVERYHAVLERNRKYDGIFYVAVKSNGIYCRPSCASPRPLQKECVFFDTVQDAASHGYTPCKHCHPDRLKNNISAEVLDNIRAGALNDKGVRGLADSLHISERHLRRIVQARTGTSPLRLNKARRLDTARLLVVRTKLPIITIAFSAEFSSLRQFNDVFKQAFRVSPREMRKTAASGVATLTNNNG